MHDKGKVFFFLSNICSQAGAIKGCYVKLSSDSGEQVKKQLCIVSPRPAEQALAAEGGPRGEGCGPPTSGTASLHRSQHLGKRKAERSCKDTRGGSANFPASDSEASVFVDTPG